MSEELRRALRETRDTLLSEPVSPRVDTPAEINRRYCKYVAETVAERLGDEHPVDILTDGGRGYAHTWIALDGRHYDVECIEGVEDHWDLPFFQRHPEATIRIEPDSTDLAAVRNRATRPLYPPEVSQERTAGIDRVGHGRYRRLAEAGFLIGVVVLAIGLGGEWSIQHHLLTSTALLRMLFLDLEILGELIIVTSPLIFYVILPAHRASMRE